MKKDRLVGFDEANEDMLRILPYSLHSYFEKLKGEGFSEEQSFTLVRDFQTIIFMKPISDNDE